MSDTPVRPQSGRPPIRRPDSLWRRIAKGRWAYLFISPFYILFAIFAAYPVAFSIYLSFAKWGGLKPAEFVGLNNYTRILKSDLFWQSMQNGVIIYILTTPVLIFVSLMLAVILNSKRVRGFRLFRMMIFMPYITNMVAAAFVFQFMLNETHGLVNSILGMAGIPPVLWLESIWGARVSLALLVVWAWLGYNMVIMLAGLQTIPRELTEAALVDGANPVQAFMRITIPLMRPVILFTLVLCTMGSFGLFTENFTLFNNTEGRGPLNATVTPIVAIFHAAFRDFKFGYASAMAYTFFALIFVATLLEMRYVHRGEGI